MGTYMPPGWPAGVHPPGSEDFESTAVGWLLDVVPPDYRLHGVLRRYPVALATMARYHSKACVEGARQGYRTARTELAGALPPHAVDTVLAAYRKEGARLAATARAVGLIERALRGEALPPAPSPPAPAAPATAQPKAAEAESRQQNRRRRGRGQQDHRQQNRRRRGRGQRPPGARLAAPRQSRPWQGCSGAPFSREDSGSREDQGVYRAQRSPRSPEPPRNSVGGGRSDPAGT